MEKDTMGIVNVPAIAFYGAQTARALANFPISGLHSHPEMVRAVVLIKKAAALSNHALGRLEKRKSNAIGKACDEILDGRYQEQFVVDVFQMGAGTSFHMNCNEVLANIAEEILGGKRGQYRSIHPNDDVNMGQSTNDVFPTAMKISALFLLEDLIGVLKDVEKTFQLKANEFDRVLKSGRTHLQDAAPVRLGQEFLAYSKTMAGCRHFLEHAARSLLEIGIGGSAVGTGLNTPTGFAEHMISNLSQLTGLKLKGSQDLREAMQSMRPMAEVSAALRNLALEMNRIANDLRLLSSGPKTGLAEIMLPAVAPGSSIMPGKVNPSMLEMMNMVCYQVIGCDLAVTGAAQAGQLELNVMMPVIAFNLCFMIEILTNGMKQANARCIKGIEPNVERCRYYANNTLGLATALSPFIGYAQAAEVAKQSLAKGKSLIEIVLEMGLLTEEEIQKILDAKKMTEPNL
ncbi:MAG: aspartate ammonia-lyase [Candidatus Aminicenantes bacterium]|nr:MAG: aspartate ammonia-lyase [Candidatus Aminicenantes bacterium]